MFTMRMNAKRFFFDRAAVIGAVDRATLEALSKAGRNIRTTARQSIRNRKAPAPPGKPPSSHGEPPGLREIWYAYEPRGRSVVVGPIGAGRAFVPGAMEFGASFTQRKTRVIEIGRPASKGGKRRGKAASERRVIKAGQKVTIAPRPFMGPALVKELPKLPQAWANSIKR